MASLVFPDRDRLVEHGSELLSLAHIPIVLHPSGAVFTEATDYLRDRALMLWRNGRKKRPSAGTVRQTAYDMTTFLDWCDETGVDWRTIERGHDADPRSLVGYARMMADGRWSTKGPVQRATIETRLAIAIDFLSYAAAPPRSWRAPFDAAPILGYGQASPSDKRYDVPTKPAVAAWLERLRAETHPAQHLMVQTIFEAGLRREEALALRAHQIPHPDAFKPGPFQHIEVSYGTKGGREPSDPDRIGKRRMVRIRTAFVERLHLHKMNPRERGAALRVHAERHPTDSAPEHLFLNPETGLPYALSQPNKLFKRGGPAPTSPWTPHMGRHFYACWTLLEFLQEEARLAGLRRGDLIPSTLEALGHASLLRLRAYLGHESSDTTDIYLAWASEHLRINFAEVA